MKKTTPKTVKSIADLPTKPNKALKRAAKRARKSVKAVSSVAKKVPVKAKSAGTKPKRASPVVDKVEITKSVKAAVKKVDGLVTIQKLEAALGRSRNTTRRWTAIAKMKWRHANELEVGKARKSVKVGRLPLVLAA